MELMVFVLHYILLYSIVLCVLLALYVVLLNYFVPVQVLLFVEQDPIQFDLEIFLIDELLFDFFLVLFHVSLLLHHQVVHLSTDDLWLLFVINFVDGEYELDHSQQYRNQNSDSTFYGGYSILIFPSKSRRLIWDNKRLDILCLNTCCESQSELSSVSIFLNNMKVWTMMNNDGYQGTGSFMVVACLKYFKRGSLCFTMYIYMYIYTCMYVGVFIIRYRTIERKKMGNL